MPRITIVPACTRCGDATYVLAGDGCAPCPDCNSGHFFTGYFWATLVELAGVIAFIAIAALLLVILP